MQTSKTESPRDASMLKFWLQLLQAKGAPLAVKRMLVTALGSPRAVLQADARELGALLRGKKNQRVQLRYPQVDEQLATLARCGAHYVDFQHADFPPLLEQIPSPPLGLFVLGDAKLLSAPQLAIVGTRKPTPSGRRTAEHFANELGNAVAITSGLASGVDYCAHRGCLLGRGKTIAVIANGIDFVYPRGNEKLHRVIVERGAVVSEYPPGAPPRREHFPQRNRIISGLALGVLVIEAGAKSGALITARFAAEQNREVFAVPGSIYAAQSRGCHRLLRDGAKLTESCEDILEEIGRFLGDNAIAPIMISPPPGDTPPLYDLIDHTPTDVDQLIEQSGLTADEVSYILMELEFAGLIAPAGGGYQRIPQRRLRVANP